MDKNRTNSKSVTTSSRFAVYNGQDGKFELGIWRKPIGAAVADFWLSDATTEELGELANIIWDKLILEGSIKGKPEEPKDYVPTKEDQEEVESLMLMYMAKMARSMAVLAWKEVKGI